MMRRAAWACALLWLCRGGLCEELLGESSHQRGQQAVGVDAGSINRWPDHSLGSSKHGNASLEGDQALFEVHLVLLTVVEEEDEPATNPEETERQLREKERLLQRMSRKHGRWDEHHPRYRLLEALRGFSKYAETNQKELDRLKGLYNHASRKQKAMLEREVQYSKKFSDVAERLARNQGLCNSIVRAALDYYRVDRAELDEHTRQMGAAGRGVDRVGVSQALKHFVRDWAAPGAGERDAAFPCITAALTALFPDPGRHAGVKVVLPGAGVGRLGHEIARLGGFQVTNNEWSMYQNVAYRFLTAPGHGERDAHTMHPFVDSWSHHRTTADMLRPVSFPETAVRVRGQDDDVVLVEGDFTTAFNSDERYEGKVDAVVTHFFIDTARNLMSYLETIRRLLKPSGEGYWINFGPLLYGTGPFVQLSLDEIVVMAEAMGFEFLDGVLPADCPCYDGEVTLPAKGPAIRGVEAVYGFDERALTKNAYNAQFWVARRRF